MEFTQVHDAQVVRAPLTGWLIAWRREPARGNWTFTDNWDRKIARLGNALDLDTDFSWFDIGEPPRLRLHVIQQISTANTPDPKPWGICGVAPPEATITLDLAKAGDRSSTIARLGPLWVAEWIERPQQVTVTVDGEQLPPEGPRPFIDDAWRARARATGNHPPAPHQKPG